MWTDRPGSPDPFNVTTPLLHWEKEQRLLLVTNITLYVCCVYILFFEGFRTLRVSEGIYLRGLTWGSKAPLWLIKTHESQYGRFKESLKDEINTRTATVCNTAWDKNDLTFDAHLGWRKHDARQRLSLSKASPSWSPAQVLFDDFDHFSLAFPLWNIQHSSPSTLREGQQFKRLFKPLFLPRLLSPGKFD